MGHINEEVIQISMVSTHAITHSFSQPAPVALWQVLQDHLAGEKTWVWFIDSFAQYKGITYLQTIVAQ